MRKLLCFAVCLWIGCLSYLSPAQAQEPVVPMRMQRILVPATSTSYGYIKYLPLDFDPNKTWPVIIYLHGNEDRLGGNNPTPLLGLEEHGIPLEIRFHGRQVPAVVLAPQSDHPYWDMTKLGNVITPVISATSTNVDRVSMAGYDWGGAAAMQYVNEHMDKLSAAAIVSGPRALSDDTNGTAPTYMAVDRNFPLWVFHAHNDVYYPCDAAVSPATNPWYTYTKNDSPWATFTRLAGVRGATSYSALDGYVDDGRIKTGYVGSDGQRYAWDFAGMDYMKDGAPFAIQQIWTLFPTQGYGHELVNIVFSENKVYDWLLGKSRTTSVPQQRDSIPASGTAYGYNVYKPEDINTRNNWPLIISLHGLSERGDGTVSATGLYKLDNTSANGIPYEMNQYGRRVPAIVVAPQLPTSAATWDVAKINNVVDAILNTSGPYGSKIDTKRIYITGYDIGGGAVHDYLKTYLYRLAAAAAICPAGAGNGNETQWGSFDYSAGQTMVQRNFAYWITRSKGDTNSDLDTRQDMNRLVINRRNDGSFGTASDQAYPTGATTTLTGRFCENSQTYNFDIDGQDYKKNGLTVNPNQLWTVYPGSTHAMYSQTYHYDTFYTWLLAQTQ